MDITKWILDNVDALLKILVNNLGSVGTITIIVVIYGIARLMNYLNDRSREKERAETIRQMERALQRIATENREYRIVIFKEKYGWTDEQVEKFIVKADFDDGPSARKALEN